MTSAPSLPARRSPRPSGTPEKPIPTYGGDTILQIPKSNSDDRKLMAAAQRDVAAIYFEADKYVGGDRIDYIRKEVGKKYPA